MASILSAGTTSATALNMSADTSGVLQLASNNGTTAVTIDTAQNVGVGVTPSAWDQFKAVQLGGATYNALSASNSYLLLGANTYYDNTGNFKYVSTAGASWYTQNGGSHYWTSASSGTAGTNISSTQVLAVGKNQTLALQGASLQSGTGISFPATQSASSDANTLDDYEEGTWSPAITGGSGTTYITQAGWYTKVGNLVTVGFEMTINAKGTITGGAAITGLPFTSGSAPARTAGYLAVANNTGTAYVSQALFLDASTTTIQIYAKTAASTITTQPNGTDFYNSNTQVIGSISYHI